MSSRNSPEITFRGQRDGEKVLLLVHRHPWALAKPGAIVMVGFVLVVLMFIWFQASRPAIWTLLLIGLPTIVYGLHAWYIWWNNMYLLTNERIIVMNHRNLWSRRIEEYSLDKIQSLATVTQGPASAILNFGSVTLAIIGIKEPVQLPYTEDAYSVQEQINIATKATASSAPIIHDYRHPHRQKHL